MSRLIATEGGIPKMTHSFRHSGRPRHRRGFTLAEVILAGLIAVLVLGSVSTSLGQLGRSRSMSRDRFAAHLRADAALSMVRRDLAEIIRADDLFFTRFLLYDDTINTPEGVLPRDEVIFFNTQLMPVREVDHFSGEGVEYEVHYRVEEDELGPVLWQRRDPVPDEFPLGGGVATPTADGIVGLSIEVYDGIEWFDEWDSDIQGLPLAISIEIIASGHPEGGNVYDAPLARLRTIVPVDRVLPPLDVFEAEEAALREEEALRAAEEAGEVGGVEPEEMVNIDPEMLREAGMEVNVDESGGEVVVDQDGRVIELPDGRGGVPGGGGQPNEDGGPRETTNPLGRPNQGVGNTRDN